MHSLAFQSSNSSGGAAVLIILLIELLVIVVVIAGLWKVFVKAGEPGWAAIVPIYNTYVLLKIVGRPWWWLILMIIPLVGLIVWIIAALDLAKSFGKSVAFAIGLILLSIIFIPILGFGDAKYLGPAARK